MSVVLSGRKGLVLGVSSESSVGYHCAKDLIARGAEVCISYRDRVGAAGPQLAQQLGCQAIQCDALDEDSMQRALSSLGPQWSHFDFVVHSWVHVPEGVLDQPLLQLSQRHFEQVLDIGVFSLIAFVRQALPWLQRSNAARVVTLLSAGADHVLPHYHAVGISKAALAACVRYLAGELGPQGVLCNAVNFSLLETAAAQRVIGEDTTRRTVEYLAKRSLTRKTLEIEDVTSAVAFLCSTDCRNISGEIVTVDGGYCHSYF